MVAVTHGHFLHNKVALAVAKQHHQPGVGVFRCVAADGALLADHEIEMAVAVNVAAIERVPMLHLADGQRLAYPGRAGPLEPARHTVAVAGNLDDLRSAAGDELGGGHAAKPCRVDKVGRERIAGVLEPVTAANDVAAPVAIHIGLRQPFILTRWRGPDGRHARPGLRAARVGRHVDDRQLRRALVPEYKLRAGIVVKVAKHHVVMLVGAVILDDPARPITAVVGGVGVLPPPDVIALIVVAGHKIEVAVTVNVVERAAGLQLQDIGLNDPACPARRLATIPHQRRAGGAARADDKVIVAVLIQVQHERHHLLGAVRRGRQVAGFCREVLPGRTRAGIDRRLGRLAAIEPGPAKQDHKGRQQP